jgi:hypothetical protein
VHYSDDRNARGKMHRELQKRISKKLKAYRMSFPSKVKVVR